MKTNCDSPRLTESASMEFRKGSATTKMIHGGLRYLEHLQFALVRESLRERAWLLALDPRWGDGATWRDLARAVAVPDEHTEVVYVYSGLRRPETLQYRELRRADFEARFGPGLPAIRDWTEEHYDFTGAYITGFDPAELADQPGLADARSAGQDEHLGRECQRDGGAGSVRHRRSRDRPAG